MAGRESTAISSCDIRDKQRFPDNAASLKGDKEIGGRIGREEKTDEELITLSRYRDYRIVENQVEFVEAEALP